MTEKMTTDTQIVTIQKAQAMEIFTKRELITPLLEKIEHYALQETFTTDTDKGRKAIASIAYRVSQSKTYIESHGKELAAELKELPKLVDSNRKYAKDFLDELRDRVRKPLDDWEAEQELIKLKVKIEIDHEQAILMHSEWEIERQKEQARIAIERAEYEAKVLADAEIKAKLAAEESARQEIARANERAAAAEREAARAEEQARIKVQQEEEQKKRLAADEQVRLNVLAATEENKDRVHVSIIEDFLGIGLNLKQAEFLLKALRAGKIKALKIDY